MNIELKVNDEFERYLIDKYEDEMDCIHYIFRFPNDYGASVVKGRYTYGGPELWEMGLIFFDEDDCYDLAYEKDFSEDVIGYLTDEEVNRLLEKIIEY